MLKLKSSEWKLRPLDFTLKWIYVHTGNWADTGFSQSHSPFKFSTTYLIFHCNSSALSLPQTPVLTVTASSSLASPCLTAALCSSASTGCSSDDVFARCFSKFHLLWQSTMDLFLPVLSSPSLMKVRESFCTLPAHRSGNSKVLPTPTASQPKVFLGLVQNQEKALGQDGEVEWTHGWDDRNTFLAACQGWKKPGETRLSSCPLSSPAVCTGWDVTCPAPWLLIRAARDSPLPSLGNFSYNTSVRNKGLSVDISIIKRLFSLSWSSLYLADLHM